jgi:hypothetical protein
MTPRELTPQEVAAQITALREAIGFYGVQVSETKILAPSSELIDALATIETSLRQCEQRLALAERKVKAFDYMKDYMGLMHDCYFALDASQPKEKASTGR